MDERTAELLRNFPVRQDISVAAAAQLFGGQDLKFDVMRDVRTGTIRSWTHSPRHGPLVKSTDSYGALYELPRVTNDTDANAVSVDSDDVIWAWCVE